MRIGALARTVRTPLGSWQSNRKRHASDDIAQTRALTRASRSRVGWYCPWLRQVSPACTQRPNRTTDLTSAVRHLRACPVRSRAVGMLLAVLASHATPVQREPSVEDFDFLPDMGRMTQ